MQKRALLLHVSTSVASMSSVASWPFSTDEERLAASGVGRTIMDRILQQKKDPTARDLAEIALDTTSQVKSPYYKKHIFEKCFEHAMHLSSASEKEKSLFALGDRTQHFGEVDAQNLVSDLIMREIGSTYPEPPPAESIARVCCSAAEEEKSPREKMRILHNGFSTISRHTDSPSDIKSIAASGEDLCADGDFGTFKEALSTMEGLLSPDFRLNRQKERHARDAEAFKKEHFKDAGPKILIDDEFQTIDFGGFKLNIKQ